MTAHLVWAEDEGFALADEGPSKPERTHDDLRAYVRSSRRYVLDARRPGGEQISELVGNASAKVLADTYTHVLMDEREVDYASVIGERLGTPAESVLA